MTKDVDLYFEVGCMRCALGGTPECKVHRWEKELEILRSYILECGLTEECKWGMPCYTYNGANVLILAAWKEFASISFFKGVLLADSLGLLHKPGEHSHEARLFKFTEVKEIVALEEDIKAYIYEAIEVEKAGLKIQREDKPELEYPEELLARMESDPVFRDAFEALTPGRKRGYLIHFTGAKQSATRTSRIEKYTPWIMEGKGMHDY
ncbi:MAG: YdeI/OmpD-associated family protein [Saprospiraceae bacterium]|nr:YdeI/OmpD-associated family protein [Saprospiraceae bacterium]